MRGFENNQVVFVQGGNIPYRVVRECGFMIFELESMETGHPWTYRGEDLSNAMLSIDELSELQWKYGSKQHYKMRQTADGVFAFPCTADELMAEGIYPRGTKVAINDAQGCFTVLHSSPDLDGDGRMYELITSRGGKFTTHSSFMHLWEEPQKFPIDSGVYVGEDRETMWIIKEFLPETREYRMSMFTHKTAHDGFAKEADLVLAVERCPLQYAVGDYVVPVTLTGQLMRVTGQNLWMVSAETVGGRVGGHYNTCQIRHATHQEIAKFRGISYGEESGRDTSHDELWAIISEMVNALCMTPSSNAYRVESIKKIRALLEKHYK